MNNKLLKIAKYLASQHFYKEAAELESMIEADGRDFIGQTTLGEVIGGGGDRSPEDRLIELLHAAEIVRKCKGKSPEEILEAFGFSTDDKDYDEIKSRLKDLMDNPFYR